MDSGSTPGNPYISEGEGLDIFQKVPYSMPIIRRSTKFQTGAGWNKDGTETEYVKPLDLKLKNKHINPSSIEGKAEKKEIVKSNCLFLSVAATASAGNFE